MYHRSKNLMRVGIYIGRIQDPTKGGSATFQMSVLNELIKSNSNHTFFIFYKNKKDLFQDTEQVKFINLEFRFKHLLTRQSKSRKLLLNEKALENKIELMWFLIPSYYFVEVPFVLTVWDVEHRLHPYFPEVSFSGWTFDARESFYQNAIPKAAYVAIGTQEGANQLEKFYNIDADRIKLIPFTVPQFVYENKPDDSILNKNQLVENEYLFYPAQFWPHKNHIRLIKALRLLKNQGVSLKVAFSGADKGNLKYIKQKVKELDLEDDVKFLGFVSESELVSLYKNAFALTYLSIFGPNNIPPLEAAALKCPIICSNVKGMEEQLKDAALFFDAVNEYDLAEKIKLLLENNQLRSELIEKASCLADSLSCDKYVKNMVEVIDNFAPYRECWGNEEKYIHS